MKARLSIYGTTAAVALFAIAMTQTWASSLIKTLPDVKSDATEPDVMYETKDKPAKDTSKPSKETTRETSKETSKETSTHTREFNSKC